LIGVAAHVGDEIGVIIVTGVDGDIASRSMCLACGVAHVGITVAGVEHDLLDGLTRACAENAWLWLRWLVSRYSSIGGVPARQALPLKEIECMSMISSPFLPDLFPEDFNRNVWAILFGQDIEGMRKKKGMSVKKAARRAGMTVKQWVAIEAGKVLETQEQVCALAEGLEESQVSMASIVLLYAGAWDKDTGLPRKIRRLYS
jgi:DNA-binding XRE family transcriptional regulator